MANYIILGCSGSGKDTAYQHMTTKLPWLANIKFSRPLKAMLSLVYGLPVGFLEDKEKRQQEVHPGCDYTYLDVMVRAFEHFPHIDPQMMIQAVDRDVQTYLEEGIPMAFTDVRNMTEIDYIEKTLAGNIKVIDIYSPHAEAKGSDVMLGEIRARLHQPDIPYTTLVNHRDEMFFNLLDLVVSMEKVTNG